MGAEREKEPIFLNWFWIAIGGSALAALQKTRNGASADSAIPFPSKQVSHLVATWACPQRDERERERERDAYS